MTSDLVEGCSLWFLCYFPNEDSEYLQCLSLLIFTCYCLVWVLLNMREILSLTRMTAYTYMIDVCALSRGMHTHYYI